MNATPARNSLRYLAALAIFALATHTAAAQITWKNADETYPPGATQNWNLTTNWNGDVVPSDTGAIMQLGSALINTAVPDITTFLIGNNANATRNRSLYIGTGGLLNVTSTAASAFRIFNTEGGHQVTVAAGGSLSVAGTLANGATTGTGSSSFFESAGTVSVGSLTTGRNAITTISGGTTAAGSGGITIGVSGSGVVNITGGAASSTGGMRIQDLGVLNVSGGSLNVTGGSGLFIVGSTAAVPRVVHVDGSGASSISFSSMRYFAQDDRDNTTWKFTLDNGTNHITPVTLTANGNDGATLRNGATLAVGLNGGVLLSGANQFTLIDRPTGAYTDTWGTGPGSLWTNDAANVDGSNKIRITLAGSGLASLDAATVGATVGFAASSAGYINLTGLSGLETNLQLKLNWSDQSTANISDFTTLLTAGGLNWWEISSNEIGLSLNPSVSGGNYFAWDLQGIGSDGMLDAITVIPEPSSLLLVGLSGLAFLLRRFPRRKA